MKLQYGRRTPARRRRLVVMVLVGMLAAGQLLPGSAQAMTSDQVAAEILRLQDKADGTAEQIAQTEMKLEQLGADLDAASRLVDETASRYGTLETDLQATALSDFIGSSETTSSGAVLFTNPIGAVEAAALLDVVTNQGVSDLDAIDAARTDLEQQRDALAQLQEEQQQVADYLTVRSAEMSDQLTSLESLRQRLKEQEVRAAYEAKLAAKRRKAAEAEAAKQAAAAAANAKDRTRSVDTGNTARSVPSPVGPIASSPNDPTPAPPPPSSVDVGDGWICPVAGANAFGDTWGAPRPGGRKHEGVDMMSPFGTPLVAVVSGNATMKTNRLGGNVVTIEGDDGNRYYYAHLSSWEGSSRYVNRGDVVGYVGATGDTTANHLHFEIHPNGGAAVNPYPTVRDHC